jgi:hypothetical protein
MLPFSPQYNNNNLSITAASQSFVIPANVNSYSSLEINNKSTQEIFIATGEGAATATTSSYPVPAGAIKVITMPINHNAIAYIGTASSGAVSFSVGGGI